MAIALMSSIAAYGQTITTQQRQAILYSQYIQACGLMYQVGIQAKSMLGSGMSQDQVISYLVQKYAYGPNGELLKGSGSAESQISSIVAAVQVDMRSPSADPETNFSTPQFYASCQQTAQQLAVKNAQANP
jgi:hypothetical protein